MEAKTPLHEDEPIAVSTSSSTRCETDKESGELKCVTLEKIWKRYADGRVVTEERSEQLAPSSQDDQRLDAGSVSHVLEGMLGIFGSSLAPAPSLRAEPRRPRPEAPAGGQWT
jgi:hypothetical protein